MLKQFNLMDGTSLVLVNGLKVVVRNTQIILRMKCNYMTLHYIEMIRL